MTRKTRDNGTEHRDNFHMIPRVVETMTLSRLAYQLYGLLKSEVQETGKSVEAGVRPLASKLKARYSSIRRAKAELIQKGLLEVTPGYRGTHIMTVKKDVWHKNSVLYHQVTLPTEPGGQQSPLPLSHPGNSHSPTEPPGQRTEPGGQQSQIRNDPLDTKIRLYKNGDDGVSAETPLPDTSFESFRDRMGTATSNQDKVAVLVDLAAAYTRDRVEDPGGRAVGLLKQCKGNGPQALLVLAKACVSLRVGDAFSYAQGIVRNEANRRPRRVEARRDPEEFAGGFWGDGNKRDDGELRRSAQERGPTASASKSRDIPPGA